MPETLAGPWAHMLTGGHSRIDATGTDQIIALPVAAAGLYNNLCIALVVNGPALSCQN